MPSTRSLSRRPTPGEGEWFESRRHHYCMNSAFEKFLQAVDTARGELSCHDFGAWYRGVSCSKYRLYPSLLRPRSKISAEREKDIFQDYVDFRDDDALMRGSWQKLVNLQHHGNPTRLLDWTEVFGVALFFAIGGARDTTPKSPSVWIINPFTIAREARKPTGVNDKRIGCFHNEKDLDYFDNFLSGAKCKWPFQSPIPYRPPKLNPRIRAQRGFFTVHGVDRCPLDCIYRGSAGQFRLHADALPGARRFLNLAGIDSLALFPDEQGFANRIKEKYQ
jgi:hypothetical protein